MTQVPIYKLMVLPLLLLLSAFFSGSETALFSLQTLELERLRQKKGRWSVRILQKLLSNREPLLTTILIGNEVINVAVSSLAASLAITLWGDRGLGVSVAVMTFLLVLYGEITPKALAVSKATKWALVAALPLMVFSYIILPVRLILSALAIAVSHPFPKEEKTVGEAEFKALVEEGKKKGVIKETEREMIHKVFRFGDARAGEIMTPRTEIRALEVDVSLLEAYEVLKEVSHREIPLYEEHLDNIVGILPAKALLGLPWGLVKVKELKEIMEEPYFIPESKEVAELLKEFQKNKLHMAIVIDEYGGVAGLITLEDIIEELVGEISDEFDRGEEEIKPIEPGAYLVSPRTSIDDLAERLHLEIPTDVDADTAGGLVFHLFGRIPSQGEQVECGDWIFTVEDVKRTRILKLRLEKKRNE
jgi:CBS domain containing-hemolysin-like protein